MIVHVHDQSQVAEARRTATELAGTLRFGDTAAGKAALVATELATNLIKHGGGGSILFEVNHALTLIAIDKGSGISNLNEAMQDGYSTAGSPGTGLGAISRVADTFDVYSLPGAGTTVLCKIVEKADTRRAALRFGGICTAKSGETISGDAWITSTSGGFTTIAVVDGLGHGPIAGTASMAAVRVVADRPAFDLDRLMHEIHGALRSTRGAAVGLARVYASQHRVDFLGVGNIAGGIIAESGETRRVVSMPGIAGHEMRKVNTFSYPWTPGSVLLLHSDGISASWNANAYPGLLQHDPSLIAAVIYRDHCRGTDDATVAVAKAA